MKTMVICLSKTTGEEPISKPEVSIDPREDGKPISVIMPMKKERPRRRRREGKKKLKVPILRVRGGQLWDLNIHAFKLKLSVR